MILTLKANGQRVTGKYLTSVIGAIGVRRFAEANSWAIDLVKKKKTKPAKTRLTADQIYAKNVLAHHYKEFVRDLRDQGWTFSQIAQLSIKQKALDRERRRTAKDLNGLRPVKTSVDAAYEAALDALNNSFLFDGSGRKRQPRERHYEKNIKKKVAIPG